MKKLTWVTAMLLCFTLVLAAQVNPSQILGKSEEEVQLLIGKPVGRIEMGDDMILTYGATKVTFHNGKAVEATPFASSPNAPLSPSLSSEPSQTAAIASVVESNPEMGRLKFKATDGTPVDLSQMRGKVVLIDFWATWCGPCVSEVPHVVETYKKYHDKGFEIIGISLDQDLKRLTDFIQKNEMTWPQYFDGRGWSNQISSANGIRAIPAMWLVDKDGHLATKNARTDLERQLEVLLQK